MNLIDAIKSGKPFRRKGCTSDWGRWWKLGPKNGDSAAFVCLDGSHITEDLAAYDVIADDWEIRRDPVAITLEQFWDAYATVLKREHTKRNYTSLADMSFRQEVLPAMARELGLLDG